MNSKAETYAPIVKIRKYLPDSMANSGSGIMTLRIGSAKYQAVTIGTETNPRNHIIRCK